MLSCSPFILPLKNIGNTNTNTFIADIHFDTVTASEKYRQCLHQYPRSIADSIGNNTNTAS